MSDPPDRLVLLGAVGRASGVRGAVQVVPFHAGSPWWAAGRELWLVRAADAPPTQRNATPDVLDGVRAEPVRISHVRPGAKGRLVVQLSCAGDRDAAEGLRSSLLGVPPEALDAPEDDEFYFHEVRGWEVVHVDGGRLGTVVRALDGAQTLLEVRPAGGGPTWHVPVVAEIVVSIDRPGARVVIDPPEGLVP